ncbi:MAG: 3-hydroxyacyl-CoA dehydrogenase [Gammaproteobacteria bacterium]|jgi:3-hydroxyacyl-CoA dehydrogenase
MEIRKVAVIGSGVMGSGIAAHVANAGVPVVLLDIPPADADAPRNAIADGALQRMLKTEPAPFMHPRNARLVSTGNLEDDLDLLADCDWIIEAVIERLDIKQALYTKLDAVRKPGCVVSSNTSTIPLHDLVASMPDAFRRDFMITHFFNPPRYMRLLEIVDGEHTRADASTAVRAFCDHALGKGVVECKDTPGFIGNRIGVYWLQCAVSEAFNMGITVEEADALIGRPAGIPNTGVFGLVDLVGLDLMPHVLASMEATLPADDAFGEYFATPELIKKMIADGYTGRKGKGGFYRLRRDGGKRVKEAIDLETGEYREAVKPRLAAVTAAADGGLRALVSGDGRDATYAWTVLAKTLSYAASLVPEIADDIVAVDDAMKLGYGWKKGPFELIDELGANWFAEQLQARQMAVPALVNQANDSSFYRVDQGQKQFLGVDAAHQALPRGDGVLLLEDIKRAAREPLARNESASLWDIGDGVLCLEFHTKMNAIDPGVMEMITTAINTVKEQFKALVIHNEGTDFSVGANLGLALFAANIAGWEQIEQTVAQGQQTYKALKYAPFPVVGAPAGMALGGGCEVLLHCDALVAHAESYMGLVEVGVGLVPAWGGCKELLVRWSTHSKAPGGPMPAVAKAFETISVASVAKSAEQARDYLFLRPADEVVMNRDRVLAQAKAKALALADDYQAPEPVEVILPGPSGFAALHMAVDGFVKAGKATAHDAVVAAALARVLTGGEQADLMEPVSEDALLDLERQEFMALVRHPDTLARIEHMLETGKPLRN